MTMTGCAHRPVKLYVASSIRLINESSIHVAHALSHCLGTWHSNASPYEAHIHTRTRTITISVLSARYCRFKISDTCKSIICNTFIIDANAALSVCEQPWHIWLQLNFKCLSARPQTQKSTHPFDWRARESGIAHRTDARPLSHATLTRIDREIHATRCQSINSPCTTHGQPSIVRKVSESKMKTSINCRKDS